MTGTADTTTRGTITISHTHQDGTILHGSAKGDGVLELARQHGFIWRKQPGIFIRGSRDRDADRRKIGGLAAALRTAGWTVETDVDNTPRTAADRRASLDERAADRADRLYERSGNAAAESERRRNASNAITDGIPFGQPVQPPGHHSRNAHLNALARSDNHMRKGIEASEKAERLEERARGTEANAAHRNNPRAIMRRIEKLETDRRSYARSLTGYRREFKNGAGKVYSVDDYPAATGERAEELRRWDARDAEEIEHLQAELAKLEAAGTFTAWGPEHFVKGDEVRYMGSWHPVRRVNKKSVSVPGGYGMAGNDATWNDTLTWDKIGGRRRDGMQWDTPNGEPWPVELARKVAQWAKLVHRAGLPSREYGTPEHTAARYVGYAQRLVHGLELDASDRQVAVVADSITGTDARRDLAVRYLAVYFRLQAGELVPAIVATLTPVTGEPAWQLPTGREPEDRRAGPGWPMRDGIELVQVGDLVAGVYDRFRGDGLHRWFCGPVTAVGDVVDRREVGEFVTITLDGDVSHTFTVGRWLAVYPAGTWEQPAGRGETGSEEETTEQDAGVPPWRILHRTPSGRLAYIVYEGPDGGPRSEYRPVQGNGGTVRVRYIADAAQPADSYDSYGWEDPKTMAVEPDASGSWRKYADRLAAGEIEPDSDGETVTAVTVRAWVLWGSHALYADGAVIRLTAGTMRHCRAEERQRTSDGGWALGIYASGDEPTGLRKQVAAAAGATRKVISEGPGCSVEREGSPEFVNYPGSFAQYVVKELTGDDPTAAAAVVPSGWGTL